MGSNVSYKSSRFVANNKLPKSECSECAVWIFHEWNRGKNIEIDSDSVNLSINMQTDKWSERQKSSQGWSVQLQQLTMLPPCCEWGDLLVLQVFSNVQAFALWLHDFVPYECARLNQNVIGATCLWATKKKLNKFQYHSQTKKVATRLIRVKSKVILSIIFFSCITTVVHFENSYEQRNSRNQNIYF